MPQLLFRDTKSRLEFALPLISPRIRRHIGHCGTECPNPALTAIFHRSCPAYGGTGECIGSSHSLIGSVCDVTTEWPKRTRPGPPRALLTAGFVLAPSRGGSSGEQCSPSFG